MNHIEIHKHKTSDLWVQNNDPKHFKRKQKIIYKISGVKIMPEFSKQNKNRQEKISIYYEN